MEIARIYRLLCEDGYYYVGATIQPLSIRLNTHRHLSKTTVNKIYTHLNNVGWDHITIELIEECPSTEKKTRLQQRMDAHKDDPLCLNFLELNIYRRGKIYSMTGIDGHYYIGSTTMSLTDRFHHHKEYSKTHDTRVYEYCKRVGWKNITMELIEDYPCDSSQELHEREEYHLEPVRGDPFCLNVNRAHLTVEERTEQAKQYNEAHRQEATERTKKYRQEHHAAILEKEEAYRKAHRVELAEKQKEYVKTHPDKVKETRKTQYEKNKETHAAYMKEYTEKNKEKIKEYKAAWSQQKKEKTKEERAEQSRIKREAREQKTQQRIAHDRAIVTCECGGTYQNYRKKRHDSSALHVRWIIASA
jgi:hypothetical protein